MNNTKSKSTLVAIIIVFTLIVLLAAYSLILKYSNEREFIIKDVNIIYDKGGILYDCKIDETNESLLLDNENYFFIQRQSPCEIADKLKDFYFDNTNKKLKITVRGSRSIWLNSYPNIIRVEVIYE